jgi:hypothetical protein
MSRGKLCECEVYASNGESWETEELLPCSCCLSLFYLKMGLYLGRRIRALQHHIHACHEILNIHRICIGNFTPFNRCESFKFSRLHRTRT